MFLHFCKCVKTSHFIKIQLFFTALEKNNTKFYKIDFLKNKIHYIYNDEYNQY